MKTFLEIKTIISRIKYKEWFIDVKDSEGRAYLQVSFVAPDIATGEREVQKGRKWWLSPHMTETEIVTTAFKAVVAAEEHEVRENFRYDDQLIYNPHFNVNDLVKLAKTAISDARNPMKK